MTVEQHEKAGTSPRCLEDMNQLELLAQLLRCKTKTRYEASPHHFLQAGNISVTYLNLKQCMLGSLLIY